MNLQMRRVLHDVRGCMETIYGQRLANLMLFGSHACGDAESGSDIDVLVALQGAVSPCEEIARTIDQVAEISLDHDVVVSCVFVSHEQFEREQSPLLLNVRREGVPI